jgi:type IV secretory pathway VirB10-like protein
MRMRCQFLTRSLFCSLLCFGLLNLAGVAFAQVYKSYDADGNVVFSDKPSERSKEVEISKPNVTDPFKIPPPPPADTSLETKPAEPAAEEETQPIADDDSADTNNDGRISRREKDEQRKEQRRKKRELEEAAAGSKE